MNLVAVGARLQKNLNPVISKFLRPQNLVRATSFMPHKLNCTLTQQLLNKAFMEQISDGDFDFLEGRLLQVEIIDARLFIGLSFEQNRISCFHFNCQSRHSDVTLSIKTVDAISLIQQQVDPDTLFFQRRLKINGDTELAHHMKNTIDTLDPEVIPKIILNLISDYKELVLQE